MCGSDQVTAKPKQILHGAMDAQKPLRLTGNAIFNAARVGRSGVTYYVLFVIDLATRKVSIAGAAPNPNGAFMLQVARNLTDDFDGFPRKTAI